MRFPDGPHVEFGPFPVTLGRTPSTARGWVNRGGYSLSVVGEAEIARSLQVARMLGLPALQSSAEGTAQVDLQIAGAWAGRSNGTTSGFTGPQVTGLAKLRNVHIAMGGAASPVEVASADMQLLPGLDPRGEVECENRSHIVDGFHGNAARVWNSRGV